MSWQHLLVDQPLLQEFQYLQKLKAVKITKLWFLLSCLINCNYIGLNLQLAVLANRRDEVFQIAAQPETVIAFQKQSNNHPREVCYEIIDMFCFLPEFQNLVQMGNSAFHQHQSSTCSQQLQHKEPWQQRRQKTSQYKIKNLSLLMCHVLQNYTPSA